MINSKGIGLLVAAIALILLAKLTQVGWLYLVDAVLWGIILLSAFFPWLGVATVSAQRKLERPQPNRNSPGLAEGDTLQINLVLTNRTFIPSYVLNFFYHCPLSPPDKRWHRFFVTNVTSSGQVSMETSVEAYQRGLHVLGPVFAESSAPFGLFRKRRKLTEPEEVLVYPQVHPLRQVSMAAGLSGIEPRAKRSRTGTDPVGSRQYAPGDQRRLIHWRNTAKTGQLMVKEMEDPVDRTTYLIFDAHEVWGEGRESSLEYGIKVVASVAHYAQRNHLPLKVLGGNVGAKATETGQGRVPLAPMSWRRLMKDLALVNPGEGNSIAECLSHVPLGASVLVAVSSANRSALQAIYKALPRLHQLTLVALEGFGEPEMPEEALAQLRAAKVPIVFCLPGPLGEALRDLESVDAVGGVPKGGRSHPRAVGGHEIGLGSQGTKMPTHRESAP